MSAKGSVGPNALQHDTIEAVLGSSTVLTGTGTVSGTTVVLPSRCYRVASVTPNPLHIGFTTINDGTNVIGSSVVCSLYASWMDVIVPVGKTIMHYTGTATFSLVLHQE